MRIAMIAPPFERVPPPKYGGTERVISMLTEGMVERGHEVVLFATGDSVTRAELRYIFETPVRDFDTLIDKRQVDFAYQHIGEFDLIHDHTYSGAAVGYSQITNTPSFTTLHIIPPDQYLVGLYGSYNRYPLVSVSYKQREHFPGANFVANIYHGIDLEEFQLDLNKEDYMLHLGAICERKGSHLAVQVALQTKKRLILAGKIDKNDRGYYQEHIEPYLEPDFIEYVGEVGGQRRINLFRKAQVLLFPSIWDEPFGLVMLEAMSCGTPVIAFKSGSVPEVIRDGKTGFIVRDLDAMCNATDAIHTIYGVYCREYVNQYFSLKHMLDNYESLYQRLANSS